MATYDLASLDEVKEYMGMTGSQSGVDDTLEDLITRISDLFHNYCKVTQFKTKTYTEYYSGQGNQELFLDQRPIQTITSIKQDSEWTFGADSTFAAGNYAILDDRVVMKDNYFREGIRNIKIVYTAGYDTIPGDLKQACIEEVVRKFKKRENVDVLSRTSIDGGITKVADGLLADTITILKRYLGTGVY